MNLEPKIPENISPYAKELLEHLSRNEAGRNFVLGGGVALNHYHEFRPTMDLDGWWRSKEDQTTLAEIRKVLSQMADRDGFSFEEREWGETKSLEIRRGSQKVFSAQISVRTVALDAPQQSPWGGVPIESLRDNLASKMNALVDRGAPRDFVDIHQVCEQKISSVEECWELYAKKNPADDLTVAKNKVLFQLRKIEERLPLYKIEDRSQRFKAMGVRNWVKNELCKGYGQNQQMGL